MSEVIYDRQTKKTDLARTEPFQELAKDSYDHTLHMRPNVTDERRIRLYQVSICDGSIGFQSGALVSRIALFSFVIVSLLFFHFC